jgi:hypothetical protein
MNATEIAYAHLKEAQSLIDHAVDLLTLESCIHEPTDVSCKAECSCPKECKHCGEFYR